MVHFGGQQYHDDRLFILHLTQAEKDGQLFWAVITRRNCEGFPPFRVDEFDSRGEAEAFIRGLGPTTPLVSLGGRGPDSPPSHQQYLDWLEKLGLPSSMEFSEINSLSPGQLIIGEVKEDA